MSKPARSSPEKTDASPSSASAQGSPGDSSHTKPDPCVLLPKEWFKTLLSEDHVWLSKSIFDEGGKLRSQLQMWYHPPQTPLVFSQPPVSPNLFFHHRFFLWMPYRMWNARFLCSQPGCEGQRLNSCGLYRTVRRVIDRVDDYYMGNEYMYLECGKCHKKSPAWNQAIMKQLGPAQRIQFSAVLSYKLALDRSIVRELRDRTLGNSPTMLQRKLQEHHCTNYLEKTIRYQCALGKFAAQVVSRPAAKALQPYRPVPTARWLLDVYVFDVHSRLDVLKAKVTSTFGTILKMGSNKRVIKKLAGEAAGTAAWSINVGNEHGQVLMSVLTASEGSERLWNMADGLMKRFESAGMPEPKLLYVN
ncbi:hypothetical protein ElyMa_000793700 [Elysia marginata]|uniref:DUF6729 domain-containing protein n=1 Tax=Elysia marginata TaxID=1093978 RepID=A0AAV4GV98_9GAST|nr:hypothetical protein ElyMa_000793700 [Elysia marginata]